MDTKELDGNAVDATSSRDEALLKALLEISASLKKLDARLALP
jgi:hypothetical protein